MFFISLAATTNSSITIQGCPIDFLELELAKLERMDFNFKIIKRYYSKNKITKLVDIKTKPSKLIALKEKIYARPYPGINIDNLPFFLLEKRVLFCLRSSSHLQILLVIGNQYNLDPFLRRIQF
jgi:UDP-N-acetylglucosamine 1-carboxyvinyltransferase